MPSREKPAIGGPFPQLTEKFSKSRTGWLAAQYRSRQSPAELPANREFYREICDFGASGDVSEARNHRAAEVFGQFPTQINKENISTNREFLSNNREFHSQGNKCADILDNRRK